MATNTRRSKSNRLKKPPPGDPWLHQRSAAEKLYPAVKPKTVPANDRDAGVVKAGPSKAPIPPPAAQDDIALIIPPNHPDEPFDPHTPKNHTILPVRRGSSRKIEQLMGQGLPPHLAKPLPPSPQAESSRGKGGRDVEYAEPVNPGVRHRQQALSEQHRYDEMLRKRDVAHDTVYPPAPRLDEWRQGGVAKLCDDMLDLDDTDGTDLDKAKAWWEAGGPQRQKSTRKRAEAYDGEYADSNSELEDAFQ